MAVRQYIGARYVTKIYENSLDPSSAEWEAGVNYEPLVMVTYNNGSYLSKKVVPASIGNPATNPVYWVQTGFYNGQIASLQNKIDDINQDLSDLLSELKSDNEFKAYRIGSSSGAGGQSFGLFNNIYYVAYEDRATGNLRLSEINAVTFDVITVHEYTVAMHPNGMFIKNNNIYIIDSDNDLIYTIDINDFSITNINSDFNVYGIFAGCVDENGQAYLIGTLDGNRTVFVIDDSFNVIRQITLEAFSGPSWLVAQNLMVYDDTIYYLVNRPNCLVCFDMEGHFIGVKEIGESDGYYPYGELESMTFDGTNVLLMTTPYVLDGSTLHTYFQVFKTNIANPLVGGSRYGQSYPPKGIMHIDNTGARVPNPVGTTDAPFYDLFEAACVFSFNDYLYTNIKIDGDFTGEYGMFSKNANISGSATSAGKLRFENATVNINGVTCSDIVAYGSSLSIYNSTCDTLYMENSSGLMENVTINTSSRLTNSIIYEAYCKGDPSVTIANSEIRSNRTFPNATVSTDTAVVSTKWGKHQLQNDHASVIKIDFLITTGGVNTNASGMLFLGTSNKVSINGGTALTRVFYLVGDGTTPFLLPITATFNTDHTLTLTKGSPIKMDGTAYTGTVNLYATTVDIEQRA